MRTTASEQTDAATAGILAPTSSATRAIGTGDDACTAPSEPLPSLTEGPYFREGSPERSSLVEPGTVGEQLLLSGTVYGTDCIPLPGTKLDFWQADGNGVYDNSGFRLRGHQFTDASGHYQLTTVVPGLYPGRTEHIHVKMQPKGGKVLTTQLFFPNVDGNQTDRLFDARLVIRMEPAGDGWVGTFDFTVDGP